MLPAACLEEVTISHAGCSVTLRPSLRAGKALERLYDGWSNFLNAFDQFRLTAVQALIRVSAVSQVAAETLLSSLAATPIRTINAVLEPPCVALLRMFLDVAGGENAQDGQPAKSAGNMLTWADAYAELYRIGTGWLGWTPAETWAATPTEISEAYKGKIGMLQAIHGGADREPDQTSVEYTPERLKEIDALGFDPAFDRQKLHGLKAKMNA